MQQLTPSAAIEKYDSLIEQISREVWVRRMPTACDWEDVAQEVRVAILEQRRNINPDHAAADIREGVIDAIRQLARGPDTILISQDPLLSAEFYGDNGGDEDPQDLWEELGYETQYHAGYRS